MHYNTLEVHRWLEYLRFFSSTPHPENQFLPPCGKHHSAKNAGQMCFSCVNDDVPLISYSMVGRQISPLRKILSSVGSLRKCLDPLGGKVELLKKRACVGRKGDTSSLPWLGSLAPHFKESRCFGGWEVASESWGEAEHWKDCLSWSRHSLEIRKNVWWARFIISCYSMFIHICYVWEFVSQQK